MADGKWQILEARYRSKRISAPNEGRQNANAERMETGWPVGIIDKQRQAL
jgi:hypothetical protein